MNVKNPQIDEGHLQRRRKVCLIIIASLFVCACGCVGGGAAVKAQAGASVFK